MENPIEKNTNKGTNQYNPHNDRFAWSLLHKPLQLLVVSHYC